MIRASVLLGLVAGMGLAAPAEAAIVTIVGKLDMGAAEGSPEQQSGLALLEKLPGRGEAVYLDLAIAPVATGENPDDQNLDFKILAKDRAGADLPAVDCAPGGSQMLDGAIGGLDFTLTTFTNHLLLDVLIAAPGAAPYNSLSCDYAPSESGGVTLTLTGFFVVQEYAIPTARGMRLVPVTPSFEAAQATVAGLAR